MNFGPQDTVALLLVALAATYLTWRGVGVLRRKRGCASGCSSCPSGKESPGKELVSLEANFKKMSRGS